MIRSKSKNIGISLYKKMAFCSVMVFLLLSCKMNTDSSISTAVVNNEDKVQAILKVQPFAYNSSDKTKISGAYISKIKLSVPKQLEGQNKWLMFEGPVLENDKVAYRYYADTRHRFDIYGKKVADLVMDTVSWKYHDIMDWGSDILKVGSSLGIGSPAILYKDSIYALEAWDTKTIEILYDKNEEAKIRTTFIGLKIGDVSMTIQQDWTLVAGGYDTTIDIKRTDADLPSDMKFATGIVSHLPNVITSSENNQYYSYTWGQQSFHKQDLGMAVIAAKEYAPRPYDNPLTHVTVFDESQSGVSYKFMAVWADGIGAINNEEDFKKTVQNVSTQKNMAE